MSYGGELNFHDVVKTLFARSMTGVADFEFPAGASLCKELTSEPELLLARSLVFVIAYVTTESPKLESHKGEAWVLESLVSHVMLRIAGLLSVDDATRRHSTDGFHAQLQYLLIKKCVHRHNGLEFVSITIRDLRVVLNMDFFIIITAVYSSLNVFTVLTSISICSDTLRLARAVLVLQEAKENGNSIAFDISSGIATEEELEKKRACIDKLSDEVLLCIQCIVCHGIGCC
ncbi:hypothetical protein RND71_039817 [Anisodus tanguticus]|uniref:Uncharacterized protein n=1 Tax=Anisodus tanguticus TaxID=243964 RepID=A0AAE1QXJ2_9SOLA|nr:hypothetical protein RND71_039817 [Anisodus tanguticus]